MKNYPVIYVTCPILWRIWCMILHRGNLHLFMILTWWLNFISGISDCITPGITFQVFKVKAAHIMQFYLYFCMHVQICSLYNNPTHLSLVLTLSEELHHCTCGYFATFISFLSSTWFWFELYQYLLVFTKLSLCPSPSNYYTCITYYQYF